MKKMLWDRTASLLTASAMTAALMLPAGVPVYAENFQFITEIRLETGENAYDTLEADGYHVMAVGLNADVAAADQICLGYRYDTGSPITNILISGDVGESLEQDGIVYECVGHTDVDAGNGGGTGCIYVTRDERAGAPLVGLDILKADAAEDQELLPIPNDGAEVVRRPDGTPCDIERSSETVTMYLAQIRDGLVAPYISEIMPVTDVSRWDAIYTAAERGYDYFIDGDIDDAADTYTIIAYKRTTDASQAITSIAAVSADMIRRYEEDQVVDTQAETEETTEEQPETGADTETQPETGADTEPEGEDVPSAELGLFTPIIAHADEPSESVEESMEEAASEESDAEPESAEETESDSSEETEASEEATEETSDETTEETSEETSEETTEAPTESQTSLTGDAIGISGIEYFRTSRTEIPGGMPYYLYATKDQAAGNPVMMLYAEELTETEDSLFGMWAYSYFSAKGETNAYSYKCNEDLLLSFQSDMTVCTKLPVMLLGTEEQAPETETQGEQPSEDAPAEGSEGSTEQEGAPTAELLGLAPIIAHAEEATETAETLPTIRLTMLTAKEGLPESMTSLSGLRTPTYVTPQLDRENRSDRKNKFPASVFGENGALALVLGGVAVAFAVLMGVLLHKTKQSRAAKKPAQETEAEKETAKSSEKHAGDPPVQKKKKKHGKKR